MGFHPGNKPCMADHVIAFSPAYIRLYHNVIAIKQIKFFVASISHNDISTFHSLALLYAIHHAFDDEILNSSVTLR